MKNEWKIAAKIIATFHTQIRYLQLKTNTMKKILLLTFLTLSTFSFGQQSESKICDCKELIMKGKKGKSAFKNKIPFTGKCITKNANGTVSKELNYYNGLLQGECKEYYKSGKLKTATDYSSNMKHGKYVMYNEKGQVIVEGEYKNRLKNGKWKYYDKDSGKISKTTDFELGIEKNSR